MTNQMGDVISITDTNGEELVEYEYDEWGKTISVMEMNDNGKFFANTNPIRYRGYYYDTETGYYYLQSRYYDPSICRFINSDIPEIAGMSKGISAGTNLFAYCNNDPINYADSLGTKRYSIRSYSKTWVTKFLLKYVSYVYDYEYTIWNFKKIPGVSITMKSFAKYSIGKGKLFSINKKGGLSASFGGISVSAMKGSYTISTTFSYKGSSVGAFVGISGKYVNFGYYTYSTVSGNNSKISIGLKFTVSIYIGYIVAFTAATYAVKALCPALAPITSAIKALYRTRTGIYAQAIVFSGALYSFAR